MKRFGIATLGVFAVIFVLDFVIHGILLKETYQQTAALWRPEAVINSMMGLMTLASLILSAVFVVIYSKGYQPEKAVLGQGLRYGLWMGLFLGTVSSLGWYVVLPIPATLAAAWFAGALAEMLAAGLVVSILYR